MDTLRRGNTGPSVSYLQRLLKAAGHSIIPDGDFGPKTEDAVEDFQEAHNLYADGIVGAVTWKALRTYEKRVDNIARRTPIAKLAGPKKYKGEGYTSLRIRQDAGAAYQRVMDIVHDHGGYVTSSGGLRSLTAKVNPNRSATSLHYTGLALDLFLYSGMVSPHEDPFVVTRDPDDSRKFVVWVRCPDGAPHVLDAVTYAKAPRNTGYPQVIVPVRGNFLNFTELMKQEGFERISCRRSFLKWDKKNNGGAEWWHFQWESPLIEGQTTFGDALLQIYPQEKLQGRPPWKYRDRVWGVNWH
jgi:hypothetical protein